MYQPSFLASYEPRVGEPGRRSCVQWHLESIAALCLGSERQLIRPVKDRRLQTSSTSNSRSTETEARPQSLSCALPRMTCCTHTENKKGAAHPNLIPAALGHAFTCWPQDYCDQAGCEQP